MWGNESGRKENMEGGESVNVKRARELAAEANEIFVTKNDYRRAVQLYTEAIALQPSEVRFFGNRSMGHLMSENLDAALNDARTCIRLEPEWPKGYFRVGTALEKMGRLEEAEAAYATAERLAPQATRAQLDYANSRLEAQLKQLERLGFSRPSARAALANHPSVPQAADALRATLRHADEVFDSEDEEELRNCLPPTPSSHTPSSQTPAAPAPLFPSHRQTKPLAASQPRRTATPPSHTPASATSSIVPGDPLTDPRNPLHCDTLWVGNLKEPTTENELRAKFSAFGRIRSLALKLDKHCGFVSFQEWRNAAEAMAQLQNQPLHGHPMLLKYPDRALQQGPALKNLVLRKKH